MSKKSNLIKIAKKSLEDDAFIKLVLSKPVGNADLKRVTARVVQIKGQDNLSIVSSSKTNDITKNYPVAKGLSTLLKLLDTSFLNASLFTLEKNYQLDRSKAGKEKLHENAPTIDAAPSKNHDHSKARLISKDRPFLVAVGVTTSDGEIKAKMNGKYSQVESFISILSKAISDGSLKDKEEISVYDMGAGSAYVSFAIHDYINSSLKKKITLTGIDINGPLVTKNNLLANDLDFSGISFVTSSIRDLGNIKTDIVVALHACNTATDDALFAGIRADAEVIIVSPCCHQEIRKKMKTPQVLEPMHKFGTHKELEAEMLTDTIRTLVLEINGYKTSLFEFVSDEHSGKNNIIVAVKKQSNQDRNRFISQLSEIKAFYRITETLYLESLFES